MTYDGHSECILLAITWLGKQSMILGMTWLNKHNPEIDFHAGTVKMTRCLPQCCVACRTECRDERKTEKKFAQQVNTCCMGPSPAFVEDADDEDDEPYTNPELPSDTESDGPSDCDFPDKLLEEGNRVWATGLFLQAEQIRATATVSQRLVEGFRQNSQSTDDERIPPHLREFHSVFSKDSFDELPASKPWDHAVELVTDAMP